MAPFDWAHWWSLAADAATAARGGAAGLESRRGQRLEALLEAARRAPYIAARLGPRPRDGWRLEALPTFTKAELMAHFDDCVTDARVRWQATQRFLSDRVSPGTPFLEHFGLWHSSGSSGEPGVFVSDAQALAVYDALESVRRPCRRPAARLLDPFMTGERIAFVGAIEGHFAGIASFERLRRLNPWLAPRLHALSILQPIEALVAALDEVRPSVVFTYPSTAVILAEESRRGRLAARPAEIVTGGETLTPGMRRFVGDAFGCPVGSEYGASEFLPLAMECRLGALHLNADWAILEPADASGRPVPAGTRGSCCLLTNLANHLQPLIRYRLDDSVTILAQACRCGSALPAIEVLGRSDDLLRLGREGVLLSPMALTTVLEDEAGLFDFQLVQQAGNLLELRCRHDDADDRHSLARACDVLRAWLHEQGVKDVEVRSCHRAPQQTGASGKLKRVILAPSAAAACARPRPKRSRRSGRGRVRNIPNLPRRFRA